jgi:hypothetical protein
MSDNCFKPLSAALIMNGMHRSATSAIDPTFGGRSSRPIQLFSGEDPAFSGGDPAWRRSIGLDRVMSPPHRQRDLPA